METLSFSAISISPTLSAKPHKTRLQTSFSSSKFSISPYNKSCLTHSVYALSSSSCISIPTARTSAASTTLSSTKTENRHWMVIMERPPQELNTKQEIVDYYAKTLERVLGSEKDAKTCIYDASCDTNFGFCCDIDEETSVELARLPGVLSVRPDPDYNSVKKDYSSSNIQLSNMQNTQLLFPAGTTKHWLVRMDKPGVGVVTKAQMVDYYAQILTKVLGNEKDAQMCIYHVSWQSNFGFCCDLDEECARELAGVPGVLSVQPDENFGSGNKDYGGKNAENSIVSPDSSEASPTQIKTKKLFVTGLSFYTSEKTLRAAFEGFGELVEVKIIMDKISRRSKGYAFIEYTTEEAASAALKEMNGKIINGWMIVVDVAKSTPKYSRGRPR
ncbi:putative RNA binding protein [Melia azedarach]|uniref:RNA binding protein n=1 Tax=Melia azedarach TaxID=155640 RepID=A0ACC1YCB7_MELAZ|nr:putative RNA binding protein [Melia azedarach]